MTEFTGVGLHCSAENCNQQDFLPFTCDCCNGTFCLPHRSYVGHSCASSGDKDFRGLVCPLCKKTVRFNGSQDPNEQWDIHRRTECNPADYSDNKSAKKRCSAPKCREVLRPTNTQRCARCGKETCLTHRFPDSHGCNSSGSWSNRGGAGSAAASAAVRRRQEAAAAAAEEEARPMSLREKAAARRTTAAASAQQNTARETADRRRRPSRGRGQGAHGAQAGGGFPGNGGGGGGGGGQQERCPQCGVGFGDVGSLVAHVESFHSEQQLPQPAGTAGDSALEQCPLCDARFADAALVVSHVEYAHSDAVDASGNGNGNAPQGQGSTCSIS